MLCYDRICALESLDGWWVKHEEALRQPKVFGRRIWLKWNKTSFCLFLLYYLSKTLKWLSFSAIHSFPSRVHTAPRTWRFSKFSLPAWTIIVSWFAKHVLEMCAFNPCENDGICMAASTGNGYRCQCTDGFTGTNCQYFLGQCAAETTSNEGLFRRKKRGILFEKFSHV